MRLSEEGGAPGLREPQSRQGADKPCGSGGLPVFFVQSPALRLSLVHLEGGAAYPRCGQAAGGQGTWLDRSPAILLAC